MSDFKTKVIFLGNPSKGYTVSDRITSHRYGEVRENSEGKWEASPVGEEKSDKVFRTRKEAAEFLVKENPRWKWDGGTGLLNKNFVGDVQRTHPEYFEKVLKKCEEYRD